MVNKILFWLLGLCITALVAGYGYVLYIERDLNNAKSELELATNSLQDCNMMRETELLNFQTALHTQEKINQIEEDTHEEVTEKFKSRKFTILSAKHKDSNTTSCGCFYDGIGWVFK